MGKWRRCCLWIRKLWSGKWRWMACSHTQGRKHARRLGIWCLEAGRHVAPGPARLWGFRCSWASPEHLRSYRIKPLVPTYRTGELAFGSITGVGTFASRAAFLSSVQLSAEYLAFFNRERNKRNIDLPTLYTLPPPTTTTTIVAVTFALGQTAVTTCHCH